MINYPNIDPIILSIGPIAIRWYSMAYLVGLLGGFKLIKSQLIEKLQFTEDSIWELISTTMVGVLLGGRLGYVLFYNASFYFQNPLKIMAIWEGGMSYHGGAIGAAVGFMCFAKTHKKNPLILLDLLGFGSTLGLGLGRLANFINGELYGRVTTVPWAMVFPNGGPLARHPSQLYEAFLEGLILFLGLFFLKKKVTLKPGLLFSAYLLGYGSFRFLIEFSREPDVQLGVIFKWVTMGQLLSLSMIIMGLSLGWLVTKNKISEN